MEKTMKQIYETIVQGDLKGIEALVNTALDAGAEPSVLLNEYMITAMDEIGERFEKGEIYVPEMLLSAHTMQAGLKLLKPMLVDSGVEPSGKVVLATVKGDLHDIGKNLVGMMAEGAGYTVVDLGVNVAPDAIVAAIKEEKPDVVGLSALLTTTMVMMKSIVDAVSEAGLRDQVKIIIGGAPVDQDYADEIGADGFGRDAGQAVQVIRSFKA
ncbi:MAG: corrinoid protein [Anaerolineales bacterium]|nr:corrinoid protein [Anaerolineales bacterium]